LFLVTLVNIVTSPARDSRQTGPAVVLYSDVTGVSSGCTWDDSPGHCV